MTPSGYNDRLSCVACSSPEDTVGSVDGGNEEFLLPTHPYPLPRAGSRAVRRSKTRPAASLEHISVDVDRVLRRFPEDSEGLSRHPVHDAFRPECIHPTERRHVVELATQKRRDARCRLGAAVPARLAVAATRARQSPADRHDDHQCQDATWS